MLNIGIKEENIAVTQTSIESLIYEIRGQKVMLDRDYADLILLGNAAF